MSATLTAVVDVSVAAQLFFPEPLTAAATALFQMIPAGSASFHVPDLFYIEAGNVFWKKVQRGICTTTEATGALGPAGFAAYLDSHI